MNDKYLSEIDQLISVGNTVLGTKVVRETPGRTLTSEDLMGNTYTQRVIPAIKSEFVDNGKYISWITDILAYLQNHFQSSAAEYIKSIKSENEKRGYTNYNHAKVVMEIIVGLRAKVKEGIIQPDSLVKHNENTYDLYVLLDKFTSVVRQLRTRHENRETLLVEDEYDVQDLLHALLRLYFDDIRHEEWTPSFAGASARMDFLLKNEQLVIETKMARKTLTDRKLGAELIEDIAHYKTHSDCKKLLCFVYDPSGILSNPIGIMNDLNSQNEGFAEVIIRPL